jgi:hypothetical protein
MADVPCGVTVKVSWEKAAIAAGMVMTMLSFAWVITL